MIFNVITIMIIPTLISYFYCIFYLKLLINHWFSLMKTLVFKITSACTYFKDWNINTGLKSVIFHHSKPDLSLYWVQSLSRIPRAV